MNIFAYGSLMYCPVWHAVAACQCRTSQAVLQDAAALDIKGEVYPGLTELLGARCDGILYYDVPPDALQRLDIFEGSYYQRRPILVDLPDGTQAPAEAYYVSQDQLHTVLTTPWDAKSFASAHLANFTAIARRGHVHIALFGGSFDPPHLGHLAIARAAMEQAGLDRVIFLPCRQSPHKAQSPGASGEQRLEMLRLATEEWAWAEVSAYETGRPPPSYSWQTAENFAREYKGAKLYWLMGADQWAGISKWARPERLGELLTFIVFPRSRVHPTPRENMRAIFLDGEFHVSSTAARALVAGNASLDVLTQLLPEPVASYILSKGLYRSETGS